MIEFSLKKNPKILDFRFLILYLCSVIIHHRGHRVARSFFNEPCGRRRKKHAVRLRVLRGETKTQTQNF